MSLSKQTVLSSLSLVVLTKIGIINGDEVLIPTDCTGLDDGLYYVKPTQDGPVMPAMCSNGYTTIDLSLDYNSVSSYFTSLYQTMPMYSGEELYVYGPGCDLPSQESSWHDWWIPASSESIETKMRDFSSHSHTNAKFTVAPECTKCEESLSYGDNTAYYMTSYYFCLNKHHTNDCKKYNILAGENRYVSDLYYDLDDSAASMCNLCDDLNARSSGLHAVGWTDCMALQLDASTITANDHDSCVKVDKFIVKPSTNDAGTQCTCYKPSNKLTTTYNTIHYDTKEQLHNEILPPVSSNKMQYIKENNLYVDELIHLVQEEEPEVVECHKKQIYLSQEDFEHGTLRILECGTYILTEDISIHFSKPSDDQLNDPNWSANDWNNDELPWHPPSTMSDYYDGASGLRGVYHAGYFTGIAIEVGDVTIDLNGHTLEMDYIYYLQQRFFSLIELGNKPFVGDQGPDNFGRMTFTYVGNVVIKNGVIGRTSHQGIHGNGAKNLKIYDLQVKNFDVSGIQCNGCKNLEIHDTVVGPQNDDIPVLGKYAHARALMPKMKYLAENYYDETVTFNNERKVTMGDIVEEMIDQMDMIYNFIVHKVVPDESESERWEAAKKIFLNPTGLQDGGSSYGIVLNGMGTAVVQYGKRHEGAENALLDNVEIFGVQNAPIERMWASYPNERQFQGFFFDPLDWMNIVETEDSSRMHYYKGDVYHDLVFAAQHIAMNDEFCLLNTINLSKLRNWVFNNAVEDFNEVVYACGSDVQSHDAKGVVGLRVDGTQGLKMKDVHIHDIQNYGAPGIRDDYFCPDGYDAVKFLTAKSSIEPGYTGTRAHGFIMTYAKVESIENLKIQSIGSHYGTAIGASVYQGSELIGARNVEISRISAGRAYSEEMVNKLESPNMLPRACSFEVGISLDEVHSPVLAISTLIDEDSMNGKEIYGYDLCEKHERLGSMDAQIAGEAQTSIEKLDLFHVKDNNNNNNKLESFGHAIVKNEKELVMESNNVDIQHNIDNNGINNNNKDEDESTKDAWANVGGIIKETSIIAGAVTFLLIVCYGVMCFTKGKMFDDTFGGETKPLLSEPSSKYVVV